MNKKLATLKNIIRNGIVTEVLNEPLDTNSVNEINIATNAVTTNKIKNKSITKDKLSDDISKMSSLFHGTYGTDVMNEGDTLEKGKVYIQYDHNYIPEDETCMYGVKFDGPDNSGDTVHRTYAAKGLVAGVGTDTETAINDFDNIYPWSERKRCCGYFDDTNGEFIVNAYEGEEGYTTDGSNGEVWVETPIFYYKHTYGEDGNEDSEEIIISKYPLYGFKPSPIHIRSDGTLMDKAYTAAYPMGTDTNGLPTSRSGIYPQALSLNTSMINARKLGSNYCISTFAEIYTKCLLMWVEFGTRDIQSIMKGCSTLAYNSTHKAVVTETSVNRIIISTTQASLFIVGQNIKIGTSASNSSIANNRTVTSIEAYDDSNSSIYFDGDPVNISIGNIVTSIPYKTGSCDNVLTSSGSPVSNTSGKYDCIYRGEESPFGNAFKWVSDIVINRIGSGTTTSPYSYDIYYLPDPRKYNNGTITDDYIKLSYQLVSSISSNGYVKKLGYDERYPWIRLPSTIGASINTYYSSYYGAPLNYNISVISVGGSFYMGNNNSPIFINSDNSSASATFFNNARLSYYR